MISDVTESLTYCSLFYSYKETCCPMTNYYFSYMKNLLGSVLKPFFKKSDQLKPLIAICNLLSEQTRIPWTLLEQFFLKVPAPTNLKRSGHFSRFYAYRVNYNTQNFSSSQVLWSFYIYTEPAQNLSTPRHSSGIRFLFFAKRCVT